MKLMMLVLLALCPGFEGAVLFLTGASCIEDLDESTLERFRALEQRPLDLNAAGSRRLVASGLVSAFQAASLIEYRLESGEILSYTELGLVDGFTPAYAEALRPFTVLGVSSPPGQRPLRAVHNDLMLRGSARESEGWTPAGGFRYRFSAGEWAEVNWSSRTTYSETAPKLGTVSAAVYGRKYLGKLVLGHFNARLGQGLVLWDGFSATPWSGVGTFRRSGTGFSPTGSFSPGRCGAAADFGLGAWSASVAYSFTDKLPMGALGYVSKRFSLGLSVAGRSVGADFKLGYPGGVVFGEAAWKGEPAAVLGTLWIPSYGYKAGALLRYLSGTPDIALGASGKTFEALVYGSPAQFRSFARFAPSWQAGPFRIAPSLRLAARHKDFWRLEGRGEAEVSLEPFVLRSRLDVVHGRGPAWLFNVEGGAVGEKAKAWLRWTLFCIDQWDDRIYVYERDVPGAFNVPAYYGRGWALSFAGSWKPSRRHRLDCRVSYVEYPWNTTYKASKFEVKLQYQLSL